MAGGKTEARASSEHSNAMKRLKRAVAWRTVVLQPPGAASQEVIVWYEVTISGQQSFRNRLLSSSMRKTWSF